MYCESTAVYTSVLFVYEGEIMKKAFFSQICLMLLIVLMPIEVYAKEKTTLMDLPFQGYFMGPEESGVEGILIENNQLLIYIKDHSRFYDNAESHHHGASTHHHEETKSYIDQEFIQWLFEFNSSPYPDLKSYSESVRQAYLEELHMPKNLQKVYSDLAQEITPEMSQLDILDLIHNRIPGIYYTEKFGYQYFVIASPTVKRSEDTWEIRLLGKDIISLKQEGNKIIDNKGIIYEYIDGIKPN